MSLGKAGKVSVNDNEPRLEKHLGLASVTLMGIGVILGAGIYVAAGRAGDSVCLSFLLAGDALIAGRSPGHVGDVGR